MKKIFSLLLLSFTLSVAHAHTENDRVLGLKKLLGPYPAAGSQGYEQDFYWLHYYQEHRTAQDCEMASSVVKANLHTFYGELLSDKEEKQLKAFFTALKVDVGINGIIAKMMFKRPRPFLTDSSLKPCVKLEKTYAYPSGHTTMARLYARVLSHLFPEREEAFMVRSQEIALSRVIGGVHHPSDIDSGNKLGDALAEEILEQLK